MAPRAGAGSKRGGAASGSPASAPAPVDHAALLAELGLRLGDRVRFRRDDGGRWLEGTVRGRERDGSIALHDARKGFRAIPIARLEVRRTGPRGAQIWIPGTEVAAADEQLGLF